MNRSGGLELTLSKPSSKELTKVKEKLRSQEQRCKQYESMCEPTQGKLSHSIIPLPNKERKISKKDIKHNHSPARLVRSKSKKLDQSLKKLTSDKPFQPIGHLYSELMTIKSEYKTLKQSYNRLVQEKNEVTEREQTEKEAFHSQLEQRGREVEKYHRMVVGFEQQIERIKRECYKAVENEKLKIKKLQQTIEEKDLMIAYLRSEMERLKRGSESTLASINQSSLLFLQQNPMQLEVTKPTSQSIMANVIVEEVRLGCKQGKVEEDSLSFSRDKSKEMDSIHSFLTAQDISLNCPTRKDIVIVETHSSYPENDSDQCPTFEQRGEEENQDVFRNDAKTLKGSVISEKSRKNACNLPPKNASKAKDPHRKDRAGADENSHDSNNQQLIDSKKHINSSRQHKKASSKKKKP